MFSKKGHEPPSPSERAAWSLALRLTVWYAASAFLLVLLSTTALYVALVQNLEREDELTLRDQVRALRQLLQSGRQSADMIRQEAEWAWGTRQSSLVHVRILDAAGGLIAETSGMSDLFRNEDFPAPIDADREPSGAEEHRSAAGKSFQLVAARARSKTGDEFIVQVALDETPDQELIAEYRRILVIVLALALVAATIGGYQIARRGIEPVQKITQTVQRVRSTHLDERIPVAGLPAELLALAETFNDMLDRLAEAFDRLARFSAEIAHELRTPINNLRGEVEVALGKQRSPEEYRDSLGSALEECDRLTRMIDGLLFLARAEHPQTQTHCAELDLGDELETVRAFYEASAAEVGVSLEVNCPGKLLAWVDRSIFQRAIGNLVANALAHTPRGGRIQLAGSATSEGIRVDVSDSGCGIDPVHLPYLFDRFYRVDRTRSSATGNVGLGLAIVKGIVELHGGSVKVESQVASGTRFTLHFPHRTPAQAR